MYNSFTIGWKRLRPGDRARMAHLSIMIFSVHEWTGHERTFRTPHVWTGCRPPERWFPQAVRPPARAPNCHRERRRRRRRDMSVGIRTVVSVVVSRVRSSARVCLCDRVCPGGVYVVIHYLISVFLSEPQRCVRHMCCSKLSRVRHRRNGVKMAWNGRRDGLPAGLDRCTVPKAHYPPQAHWRMLVVLLFRLW